MLARHMYPPTLINSFSSLEDRHRFIFSTHFQAKVACISFLTVLEQETMIESSCIKNQEQKLVILHCFQVKEDTSSSNGESP